MSVDTKKKKKLQVLETETQEKEVSGSTEYIANREIDQIIKKGRERLNHAITLSDEKLTRTKKSIVKEMAEDMEKANYPINQICDRLAKSLKGLVHERTVRDALESKYKNTEQSEVAKMQNQNEKQDGGSLYRQQQRVIKKPVEQITLEDIKLVDFPKPKLRQIAKHQMEKNLWFEQQDKQNKDIDKDKDKDQIAQQKQKQVLDPEFEDEKETVNVSDLVFPANWIKRKGDNFELLFVVDLPNLLQDIAQLVKRNKTEDDYVCLGLRAIITFDSKTGEIQKDEFEVIDSRYPWDDYAQDYDIPKQLWKIIRGEKRKEEKINKEKAKPKPNNNTDT